MTAAAQKTFSGNRDLRSKLYTTEAKQPSQSKSTAVVLYTIPDTAIAITLYGTFGGWIADNGCVSVGAEFSELLFTFQTMIKGWVSTMAIYVHWKSNSQTARTA